MEGFIKFDSDMELQMTFHDKHLVKKVSSPLRTVGNKAKLYGFMFYTPKQMEKLIEDFKISFAKNNNVENQMNILNSNAYVVSYMVLHDKRVTVDVDGALTTVGVHTFENKLEMQNYFENYMKGE